MASFVERIDAAITALIDFLVSMVGAVVTVLEAPAQAIGIPAGVFAAALLLLVLILAWRTMNKYIM